MRLLSLPVGWFGLYLNDFFLFYFVVTVVFLCLVEYMANQSRNRAALQAPRR